MKKILIVFCFSLFLMGCMLEENEEMTAALNGEETVEEVQE